MARSGRFSGEMRPRKATYPPRSSTPGRCRVDREAMVDGRREVRVWHRAALRFRDRDQRHVVKSHIERKQIGQILAAVQRGDGAARDRPEQRKLELVDMEVQYVEFVGALADAIEHQHVIGNGIANAGVEPQRLGHAGNEIGRRDRIAAREQRDVMAERHQLLSQVRDDALGAAIEPWGNAFDQRRDLRDFHMISRYPHIEPLDDPKVPSVRAIGRSTCTVAQENTNTSAPLRQLRRPYWACPLWVMRGRPLARTF